MTADSGARGTLAALAAAVGPPDGAAREAARIRQAALTKPPGALGRLEDLSVWAAAVQGRCPPRPFARPRAVVVAGDHGVARAGVSAYPPQVTAQMVRAIAAGGGAVHVLADVVGATVRVLDIAVDDDGDGLPRDVLAHKVRRGSGDIRSADAVDEAEAARAVEAGMAVADEEIDAGADLLVPGDMGIGNTTPAAVVVGALTDTHAAAVVGRGTGVDDAGWMRKTAAIRDALRRARPLAKDPDALLRVVGGADLLAMTALLLRAAGRRTPVLLDGVVPLACALAAHRAAPAAVGWWQASHASPEPAAAAALQALGLDPLLDLGMRLGEASGALVALPLLQQAVATLARMQTFDEAGVSDRTAPGDA